MPQGQREPRRTGCESGCGDCVCLKPCIEPHPPCGDREPWSGELVKNGSRCEDWNSNFSPCIVSTCVTTDEHGNRRLQDGTTPDECRGDFKVWRGSKRSPFKCGGKSEHFDNKAEFDKTVKTSNCVNNMNEWPGLWSWQRVIVGQSCPKQSVIGGEKRGYIRQPAGLNPTCEVVPVDFTAERERYCCPAED